MKNFIQQLRYYRDRVKNHPSIVYFLFIGLFLVAIGGMSISLYSHSITDALSDEVIRFHVVANSDTVADQMLKQQVRDEVIAYMEPMLRDSRSIDETRELIRESLSDIQSISEGVVQKWNKNYNIYVALDQANFPTKAYGDVIFPAGKYEACRIIIGEGKGENWWCVMFPPLCYVDASSGVVPLEGKEQLKKQLNEEQYNLVVPHNNKPYQVRFKLVDTINSYFDKPNYKKVSK